MPALLQARANCSRNLASPAGPKVPTCRYRRVPGRPDRACAGEVADRLRTPNAGRRHLTKGDHRSASACAARRVPRRCAPPGPRPPAVTSANPVRGRLLMTRVRVVRAPTGSRSARRSHGDSAGGCDPGPNHDKHRFMRLPEQRRQPARIRHPPPARAATHRGNTRCAPASRCGCRASGPYRGRARRSRRRPPGLAAGGSPAGWRAPRATSSKVVEQGRRARSASKVGGVSRSRFFEHEDREVGE